MNDLYAITATTVTKHRSGGIDWSTTRSAPTFYVQACSQTNALCIGEDIILTAYNPDVKAALGMDTTIIAHITAGAEWATLEVLKAS